MQKLLYGVEMAVANGDDTVQLTAGAVILLAERLATLEKVSLKPALQLDRAVLCGAGTHHEQKTRPLEPEGLIFGSGSPPVPILVAEGGGIDDEVMEVDVRQKVVNKLICDSNVSISKGLCQSKVHSALPTQIWSRRECIQGVLQLRAGTGKCEILLLWGSHLRLDDWKWDVSDAAKGQYLDRLERADGAYPSGVSHISEDIAGGIAESLQTQIVVVIIVLVQNIIQLVGMTRIRLSPPFLGRLPCRLIHGVGVELLEVAFVGHLSLLAMITGPFTIALR
jgi:hypothetical protein